MVILVGLRMGIGALSMWRAGFLEQEFPRYQYQRLVWEREGKSNTQLALQIDAISQGMANASFLALPIFITASNHSESFVIIEFIGIGIWLFALVFESIADFQKLAFLRKMKKKGKYNQVCNVGLWKYSRHPNYFSEWMVWNAMIIASISSFSSFFSEDQQLVWIIILAGLIYISYVMYTTLVYYTGAIPSEFYTLQKRPNYKAYQDQTNMFFPGPKKLN